MGAFEAFVRYVYVGLPNKHIRKDPRKKRRLHPPNVVEKVGKTGGSQLLLKPPQFGFSFSGAVRAPFDDIIRSFFVFFFSPLVVAHPTLNTLKG